MQIESKKVLLIKLKGEEIDTFKDVVKKLNNKEKSIGFKSDLLTDNDKKFIDRLDKKINA